MDVHKQLDLFSVDEVLARAATNEERTLIQAVAAFRQSEPTTSFLHSALCSMSLPTRRPTNEFGPIVRKDGRYTLMIAPRDYPDRHGGIVRVGVPFGAKARLVLIQLMTEAVRANSPRVYLGKSLSHWMRRLGYTSLSGGPQGTMTLFREQVQRLARCEWTIRRDEEGEGAQLTDVRLTDDLALWNSEAGEFVEEIALNERFFAHLKEHAVPLDERALAHLRDSPTALDLYVWLVYRLSRLQKPAVLSWEQLAVHFGNDYANLRQFRYELRKLLPKVLAFYPGARVDMSDGLVRLYPSPPAVQRSRVAFLHPVERPEAPANSKPAMPKASERLAIPAAGALDQRFFEAVRSVIEAKTFISWFATTRVADAGDGTVLVAPSVFAADWIRNNFGFALAAGAQALGLERIEVIGPSKRPTPTDQT